MPSLRSAWNPLTPLAAVLFLSLASLAAPREQRLGWLGLVLIVLSPVAAFLSLRALRSALARAAPVPAAGAAQVTQVTQEPGAAGAAGPAGPSGRVLRASLRALLAVVAFLVPLSALVTEYGAQNGQLAPAERALTLALPFAFWVLGAQLWRDLGLARGHARGPGAPAQTRSTERASITGLAALDARIGRRPRAAARIAWVLAFVSAASWIATQVVHAQPIVGLLMKENDRIREGEVWRVFTATAVHGSLTALILNGAAFFAVAPLLELLLGAPRLVFVFLVGGVAATLASFALAPSAPYMGASGAVAAVAGALLAFGARSPRLPAVTRRRTVRHGAVALAAVALAGALLPEVDLPAVGGGLLFGLLAGLAFEPPQDTREALELTPRQESAA